MEGDQKRTSPWVWVGVGCLAAIVLIIVAVVGVGYLGYRQLRQMQATMEDPVARAAEVRRILGADQLPEGYYPVVGFSVPLLMEMAMLSDRPADDVGEFEGFDEHGFLYIRMLTFGEQERELRDFIEGSIDETEALEGQPLDFRRDELLTRGVIDEDNRTLRWVAYRGEIEARSLAATRSIMTMTMIECRDDDRTRLGIWFGPDPSPESPVEELDLAGTVADETQVAAFLAHFDVCR